MAGRIFKIYFIYNKKAMGNCYEGEKYPIYCLQGENIRMSFKASSGLELFSGKGWRRNTPELAD
jgi:hypothetical protein